MAVGTEDGMVVIVDVELDVVVTQLSSNTQTAIQSLAWAIPLKASHHIKVQHLQPDTQTIAPASDDSKDQMILDSPVASQVNSIQACLESKELEDEQQVQIRLHADTREGAERVTCIMEVQSEVHLDNSPGNRNDSLIAAGMWACP